MKYVKLVFALVLMSRCFAMTDIMEHHQERCVSFNKCNGNNQGYSCLSADVRAHSNSINSILSDAARVNRGKSASMDDKKTIAMAIFAERLTETRLFQIDSGEGILHESTVLKPYRDYNIQDSLQNHFHILQLMYTLANELSIYMYKNLQTRTIGLFMGCEIEDIISKRDYSNLFRLSNIRKSDYSLWIQETILNHTAGAFSEIMAAIVDADMKSNRYYRADFWANFSQSLSVCKGSIFHKDAPYSWESLSRNPALVRSASSHSGAFGAGGGSGSGPRLNGYSYESVPSHSGAFGAGGGSSSGARFNKYSYGSASSHSGAFGARGGSVAWMESDLKEKMPKSCNPDPSTGDLDIHIYAGTFSTSPRPQVILIDQVLEAVKKAVKGKLKKGTLSQEVLLARINAWIDRNMHSDIFERKDTTRSSFKEKIAEALFPTHNYRSTSEFAKLDVIKNDTIIDLNAIFAYLDQFYPREIDLWMNAFIVESLEAKRGGSCENGIRDRMITGLRYLDDPDLNALFEPSEKFKKVTVFWTSLNFSEPQNAQWLAEKLKERGVTKDSSTAMAIDIFRKYVVDYIRSEGLSEFYTDEKRNYQKDIKDIVDVFGEYYEDMIKIYIENEQPFSYVKKRSSHR